MDCGGSVKFAEGLVLSSEDAIRIGWGIELINCTLDFVARLSDIQMDNTEFCILNAVILTYPGKLCDIQLRLERESLITCQMFAVCKTDSPVYAYVSGQ